MLLHSVLLVMMSALPPNVLGLELNPLTLEAGPFYERRFGNAWSARVGANVSYTRVQDGDNRPSTVRSFGAEVGVARSLVEASPGRSWVGIRTRALSRRASWAFGQTSWSVGGEEHQWNLGARGLLGHSFGWENGFQMELALGPEVSLQRAVDLLIRGARSTLTFGLAGLVGMGWTW